MRAVVERAGCSTGRHNRHLHSQSLGIIRTTLLAALYVGAISNPWDNELSPSTLLLFSRFSAACSRSFFFLPPSIKPPPNEIRFFRTYSVRRRVRSLLLSISFHFQSFSLLIFYTFILISVLINRRDAARKKHPNYSYTSSFGFIFVTNLQRIWQINAYKYYNESNDGMTSRRDFFKNVWNKFTWKSLHFSATARFFLSLTRSKIVFANVESIECLARIVEEDHLD